MTALQGFPNLKQAEVSHYVGVHNWIDFYKRILAKYQDPFLILGVEQYFGVQYSKAPSGLLWK